MGSITVPTQRADSRSTDISILRDQYTGLVERQESEHKEFADLVQEISQLGQIPSGESSRLALHYRNTLNQRPDPQVGLKKVMSQICHIVGMNIYDKIIKSLTHGPPPITGMSDHQVWEHLETPSLMEAAAAQLLNTLGERFGWVIFCQALERPHHELAPVFFIRRILPAELLYIWEEHQRCWTGQSTAYNPVQEDHCINQPEFESGFLSRLKHDLETRDDLVCQGCRSSRTVLDVVIFYIRPHLHIPALRINSKLVPAAELGLDAHPHGGAAKKSVWEYLPMDTDETKRKLALADLRYHTYNECDV